MRFYRREQWGALLRRSWRGLPPSWRVRAWALLNPGWQARLWAYGVPTERLEAWLRRPPRMREVLWDLLPRAEQDALWTILSPEQREELLWPDGAPRDGWHSFDRHPWKHPWLQPENIRGFRQFSDLWISRVLRNVEGALDRPGRRYAFVGNMANNLYSRAKAMGGRPVQIDIFPHPHDRYLMSHPAWEEFDGVALESVDTIDQALEAGMALPNVLNVRQPGALTHSIVEEQTPEGMRVLDVRRYQGFFMHLPTLKTLREYDAVLAVQFPYMALLAGKPYVATQMGGEIWYDASRNDVYGHVQREAYIRAGAFIVSNPWSLAFARRYGLSNLVYVPFLIDENRYSPGPGTLRGEWQGASGGDFLVFMSSRQDYRFKGSDVAIRGFARFAAKAPRARLVVTAWGADKEKAMQMFRELGIADRVHVVPIAGKRRLVDYLRSSDCVLDQLTLGYYGASALEAFACGRPVVMNLNKAQYDALIPEGCAPVCQAATEDEVAAQLERLYAAPELAAAAGDGLRRWFLQTHDNRKWGRVMDAILLASSMGRLPDFHGSPLDGQWDNAEAAYLAAELAAAPPFPQYF